MAKLKSKTLFIITSPRTPGKMIPEIDLLAKHFAHQPWNQQTQAAFMAQLKEADYFHGSGAKDPAFSARDRINRAPKALGFVALTPTISLTPAGTALLTARRKEEVMLRQMLKFQLPSPLHLQSTDTQFRVKPFLEIFRLVRHFGTLKFDELKIFAMQLIDYQQFDVIVKKIEDFRAAIATHKGSYRRLAAETLERELRQIYASEIAAGSTKTRESNDRSTHKFLKTKASNMRDYADACFRYLRATGLVSVSHVGKSLSIVKEHEADVDYFLATIDREPYVAHNEADYINYLGNAATPCLLTDSRQHLIDKIRRQFPHTAIDDTAAIDTLKDLYADLIEERKQGAMTQQVAQLKNYQMYDDIQALYNQIVKKDIYDAPLMMEWNTWRAMTMLNGGQITANLNFDDYGQPLSTAPGGASDIVCDYGSFRLSVEVTLSTGQRQYEMEGEPVSRHLGNLKKASDGKPAYCLFIAPTITAACISHFYILHRVNVAYYGGTSDIVPIELDVFKKMVEDSRKANFIPTPNHVQRFFQATHQAALNAENEKVWYEQITNAALHWLEL